MMAISAAIFFLSQYIRKEILSGKYLNLTMDSFLPSEVWCFIRYILFTNGKHLGYIPKCILQNHQNGCGIIFSALKEVASINEVINEH